VEGCGEVLETVPSAPKEEGSVERLLAAIETGRSEWESVCQTKETRINLEYRSLVRRILAKVTEEAHSLALKVARLEGSTEAYEKFISRLGGSLKEVQRNMEPVTKALPQIAGTLKRVEEGVKRPSYAQKAASAEPVRRALPPKPSKLAQPAEKAVTVIVKPLTSGPGDSAEATRLALIKSLDPRKVGIQVSRVTKRRDNSIAITLPNKLQATKLMTSGQIKSSGLVAALMTERRPRVLIYDLPGIGKSAEEEAQILEAIVEQNPFLGEAKDFAKTMKVVRKLGKQGAQWQHWVVEVNPEHRQKLVESGRVFLGWRSSRVVDFVEPSRCYKCQRFGHTSVRCTSQLVCGHCSKAGHGAANCPHKQESPVCALCKDIKGADPGHVAGSKKCPAVERAKQWLINSTSYGC
jgi:hypothetical protein